MGGTEVVAPPSSHIPAVTSVCVRASARPRRVRQLSRLRKVAFKRSIDAVVIVAPVRVALNTAVTVAVGPCTTRCVSLASGPCG